MQARQLPRKYTWQDADTTEEVLLNKIVVDFYFISEKFILHQSDKKRLAEEV